MHTLNLEVPKVKCAGCAAAIEEALTPLPEVRSVAVDVDRKTVAVTMDDVTPEGEGRVREALQAAGFAAA